MSDQPIEASIALSASATVGTGFDRRRFRLILRLASLDAERDAVAAARTLPEIDHDIAAVQQELEARHGA